ncbi:MAG TPA: DUF5647 family protein [bacterium]
MRKTVIEKNLELGMEFSRYVLEHPRFAAKIPLNALVVFLPEYDPELSRVNLEIAKKQREDGQPVVHVHFKKLKLVASRLVKPRLEIIEL